jgi:hypothetical protein
MPARLSQDDRKDGYKMISISPAKTPKDFRRGLAHGNLLILQHLTGAWLIPEKPLTVR